MSLLSVICPDLCKVCGAALVKGEREICLNCLLELPRVRLYPSLLDNEIHSRLTSTRYRLGTAASLFYYVKTNPYARLIHLFKYRGHTRLGARLTRMLLDDLRSTAFFAGIEGIVPVPMPGLKKFFRGYNQAELIAREISAQTGIPVLPALRARYHATQTRKTFALRYLNVRNRYVADVAKLPAGVSRLLFVDDVITTGATMSACMEAVAAHIQNPVFSALSLTLTNKN